MHNVDVSSGRFNKEEYWKEFVEYAFEKSGNREFLDAQFPIAPIAERNWYALRVGSAKLHIELSFNTQKKSLRTALLIKDRDLLENLEKVLNTMNLLNRVNINKESQTANISLGMSGVDLTSASNRIAQFDWFMESACLFKKLADTMLMSNEKSTFQTSMECEKVFSGVSENKIEKGIISTSEEEFKIEDWDNIFAAFEEKEEMEKIYENAIKQYVWHSKWEENSFSNERICYVIDKESGREVLKEIKVTAGGKVEKVKIANSFALFHTSSYKEDMEYVRILAEFSDKKILFSEAGELLVQVDGKNSRDFECYRNYFYCTWVQDNEEGERQYIINLITGRGIHVPNTEKNEWSFFKKDNGTMIFVTGILKEGKKVSTRLWDDESWKGIHQISKDEIKNLGELPFPHYTNDELEKIGYKRSFLGKTIRIKTFEVYQKLSGLKITDENRYFSREEAKQFIHDFLETVEWKEVRDLGGERYIVKVPMSDEFRQKYFILNAILNMNNVEAFAKGDNIFYDSFYKDLIYDIDDIIQMMINLDILTPVHGRYDWISSCVDGNVFSLKTRYGEESSIYSYDDKKKSNYREYEELSIINVMTGEEESIKAYIRIHNCQESVCRIVINFAEHYAKYAEKEGFSFYIFDVDGKVILKKQGQHTYRCGNKRFAELLYREKSSNGKFKQIGLYDEITGNEIVPIQYDYVSIWKKNDGSILAVGIPEILDCKKEIDYYEYDLGGESQVVRRPNIYPTSVEVCDESINRVTNKRGINILVLEDKLKSMGYEEIELIYI